MPTPKNDALLYIMVWSCLVIFCVCFLNFVVNQYLSIHVLCNFDSFYV